MANEGKNIFIIILIVLIVMGIGYTYSKNPDFFKNLLGAEIPFFYDPYLVEDDFSIPSLAFQKSVATNPTCIMTVTSSSESWICNDGKWEINGMVQGYKKGDVTAGDGLMGIRGCVGTQFAKYLINLKNKDIKIKFGISASGTSTEGCGSGSGSITLGGINVFSDDVNYCGSRGSAIKESLIEMIKDVTDKNKFVIIVNGQPTKEVIIQGDTAFLSFTGSSSCTGTDANQPLGGAWVDYIKSKPYFSCQVDNNEAWISDSFGEGSTFDIHSLTYEPTKFCPQDYPAVVRDYRERGIKADIRGTITEQLTRGESFTVPAFQSYEIRYATAYKEGMGTRCDINQVYDTKLNKCVGKIFEQDYIIKDCHSEGCPVDYICRDNGVCEKYTEVVINNNCLQLGCPSGYECLPEGYCVKTLIQQIKPTCADITCDSAYMEYCEMRGDFPVCVRPYKIVEIIRDREIITVGKNQKSFVNNILIGDSSISSSSPSYSCGGSENQNSPYPRADCWQSSVSFGSKAYTLQEGMEIDLNNYLKLKLSISALYHKECDADSCRMAVKEGATNNFILTIKDFNFLQTVPIRGNEFDYYAIKDKPKEMCFKIINNLGISFNSEQAGYSLKKTTDLVTMQTTSIEQKSLPSGTTEFCIPVDTARYGEIFYQVNPYIKIGDEVFFDDEQIVYNYKIVDKIPANETVIYKPIYQTTYQNVSTTPTTIPPKETNWWVYGGIAGLIILLVFLLSKKR